MDWTQSLTIIFSTAGLVLVFFIYLMSRMDNKFAHMDTKFEQLLNRMDSNQKENNTRFNGIENRLTSMESEIKNTNQRVTDIGQKLDQRISDVKTDMNQRLSSIETENKDIGKRLSSIEGYLAPNKVFHFEESHKDADEPKEN